VQPVLGDKSDQCFTDAERFMLDLFTRGLRP